MADLWTMRWRCSKCPATWTTQIERTDDNHRPDGEAESFCDTCLNSMTVKEHPGISGLRVPAYIHFKSRTPKPPVNRITEVPPTKKGKKK